MAELGIESIAAYSPQAKGRIERLWGTLQDRLTKELRLAGITTLAEANAFLPGFVERYNARFVKAPADPNCAWVPLPADLDLPYYFATRETRTVRADHCLRFAGQLLQVLPSPHDPSLVAQRITVHRVPEGNLYLYHGKRRLAYQPWVAPAPAVAPPPAQVTPPPAAKVRQNSAKQLLDLADHDVETHAKFCDLIHIVAGHQCLQVIFDDGCGYIMQFLDGCIDAPG